MDIEVYVLMLQEMFFYPPHLPCLEIPRPNSYLGRIGLQQSNPISAEGFVDEKDFVPWNVDF